MKNMSKNGFVVAFVTFLLMTTLVCVVNRDALFEKPVWDTVGGIFAPAIYLYENGFDFASLLKEEGF